MSVCSVPFTLSIPFPIYWISPDKFLVLGHMNFYKISFYFTEMFFFMQGELVIFEEY